MVSRILMFTNNNALGRFQRAFTEEFSLKKYNADKNPNDCGEIVFQIVFQNCILKTSLLEN